MLRIGVNGYGTIGKRVADAIAQQDDMEVIGVTKSSPGHETKAASSKYPLYGTSEIATETLQSENYDVEGSVEQLVERADVMVDAAPAGVGKDNKPIYSEHDTPAVFQGGEPADVADVSFNSVATYEAARDADYVRVVSCNTTALSRLVAPLENTYGVESVRATLIRRGGDPNQHDRGPINDILPDPQSIPSHHAPDLRTIYPNLDIITKAVTVPSTLMHLHSVTVELTDIPGEDDVIDTLSQYDRLSCLSADADLRGCAAIKEAASDRDRPRDDVWENCIWNSSVTVENGELHLYQAVHQEANVIPENIDAIRAIAGEQSGAQSRKHTNEALNLELSL